MSGSDVDRHVDHDVPGQPAPFESARTNGGETVRCASCGGDVLPVGRGQCSNCGAFVAGNTAALVHGGRRLELGHETPLDETRRVTLRDAVLSDLGGRQECSAALVELVEDFASACVLRDVAYAHIAAVGPLTQAGRRRAVVDLYLQASARAERLASQIGTSRKPARVPSLTEYLAQKYGSQQDAPGGPPDEREAASRVNRASGGDSAATRTEDS